MVVEAATADANGEGASLKAVCGADSCLAVYIAAVIQPSRRLAEFEARYGREAFREMSYAEALALFAALWAEARALPGALSDGSDWRADLEPDFAIARAVNGLAPRT